MRQDGGAGAGPATPSEGVPTDAIAPVIYTIGYEGLVQAQLLDLISASGAQLVLDVRAVAASRKAGFSKTVLRASLAAQDILYVHDIRLGTPKSGRQAVRCGRVPEMVSIFTAHMQTEPAQAGLADAVILARRTPICLLCFERAPHDCHRALIASLIRQRTAQSIHHL